MLIKATRLLGIEKRFTYSENRNHNMKIQINAGDNDNQSEKRRQMIGEYISARPYAIAKGNVGNKHQLLPHVIRHLPQVLKLACLLAPDKGILHVDENGNERMQTNAELLSSAKCVLSGLKNKGLVPGDQVVIQVDNSPSFLAAFWGALLGGFIAVPLPIPGGFPVSEGMERITKVCSILEKFCIVTDQSADLYKSLGNVMVFDISELKGHEPARQIHKPKTDDTAILLFSSGSTGDPKGVILSHKNIMHALEAGSMSGSDVPPGDLRTVMLGYSFHILKRKLFKSREPGPFNRFVSWFSKSSFGKILEKSRAGKYLLDTFLIMSGNKISVNLDLGWDDVIMANWMPYSHVVALIGLHLGPTMLGFDQVTLSPKTFIEKPAFFLKLIDKYRISYFPCPNFAVQWLTTQVADEDIEGIDLSCVRAIGNAAEPISPAVTRKFMDKFGKYGLDSKSPCLLF